MVKSVFQEYLDKISSSSGYNKPVLTEILWEWGSPPPKKKTVMTVMAQVLNWPLLDSLYSEYQIVNMCNNLGNSDGEILSIYLRFKSYISGLTF